MSKVDTVVDEVLQSGKSDGDELVPVVDMEDDKNYRGLLIPSGSVMLNLACSDRWYGAYRPGRIVNLIGDSSAGKTLLALSMFGEMSIRPEFDAYRFIYDDTEHALDFSLEDMFGKECASRIEPPAWTKDSEGNKIPKYSDTIQDFHMHVTDVLDAGKPFVYILDSFDALTSVQEREHVEKELEAMRKGKESSGSYGMEKAKIAGQILRMIVSRLKETQSLLLIISQTRDNISPTSFATKTRSGGRALKFYSSHEIWLAVANQIKRTVSGLEYTIGNYVAAKVTKNKLTGKLRQVSFPVYYDYGVDDLKACLEFLEKTKAIEKEKQTLKIEQLGLTGKQATIIKEIENQGRWDEVYALAGAVWNDIEKKLKLDRRSKFTRKS